MRAVASGRQRGAPAAVAPGRAAVRRPQGRAPPPGHGVRRRAGPHEQPRRSAIAARAGARRPAGRSVRQLARRDDHRDPSAACDQEGRGRRPREGPRRRGRGRPRPRPGQGPAAAGGRPGVPRARAQRPRRPDEAEPAGRSTARSRSSCASSTPRSPTRSTRGTSAGRPPSEPLQVVDLGCGNAYLTFVDRAVPHPRPRAAGPPDGHRPARAVAHPQREDRRRARRRTRRSWRRRSATRRSTIRPDVVLALHACDTATDDALARAVAWETPLVLAAPCCHHDIAAQLRTQPTPAPYAMLTRHGILRERFADTLTDGLRASLMRLEGYRVDVMQFVGSQHTPRNTLLRGVRTGRPGERWRRAARVRRAGRGLGRAATARRAARAGVTGRDAAPPGESGHRRAPGDRHRGRRRRHLRGVRSSRSTTHGSPRRVRSSSTTACSSRPTTRGTPATSSPSTAPAVRSA